MLDGGDADGMLAGADGARRAVRARARWYPAWLVVFGLFTIVMVGSVPLWHGTVAAVITTLVLLAFIYGMRHWTSRQPVVARGGRRRVLAMTLAWVVLLLLVELLVGPRVLGDDIGLWALGGVVVALPPFAEAVLSWRRLSR